MAASWVRREPYKKYVRGIARNRVAKSWVGTPPHEPYVRVGPSPTGALSHVQWSNTRNVGTLSYAQNPGFYRDGDP